MGLMLWAGAWGAAGERRPAEGEVRVAGPERLEGGVLQYRVRSPYQRGETLVRIVVPTELPAPERRRVLFVLPVEPGTGSRYGDGLRTALEADVANRHGFIVVAPTFADWPWYADHPTDPGLRQETYVLEALLPLVARLYPHEAGRRALLGFSKSGWGAYTLLLRHPAAFGAACAWDAPMMMAKPLYEMARIVGTQEGFERYRVPTLLRERAEAVRGSKRLGLFGYGNFRKDTQEAHALMQELGIAHDYADGPPRKHRWDSGWMEEALRSLRAMVP